MENHEGLVPHRQVWGDKVRGSWWKAIVIFALYVILLILFQGVVMRIGGGITGEIPKVEDGLGLDYFVKNIQAAQWWYHLSNFVLIIILLSVTKLWKMKFFDLGHIRGKYLWWTFGIYIGMYAVQWIYSFLIPYIAPDYVTTSNQELVNDLFMGMHWLGSFINIVIITPILEELLVRGLIMKYIFPLTPFIGFLASTLIFTFLHSPSNIIDFSVYFIMAISISYVYWRTRRLEYPILFHMLNNGMAFLSMMIMSNN